jgi:hypothetical protein
MFSSAMSVVARRVFFNVAEAQPDAAANGEDARDLASLDGSDAP